MSITLPIVTSQRHSRSYALWGLLLALFATGILATAIGSVRVPFLTTSQILLSRLPAVDITPAWPPALETIVLNIRLPRVIMAGIVGAALATAGATYQGLFRNPLADPYLIGVAQGAAVGAIIGFLLPSDWHILGFGIVPLLGFAGALTSTALVYLLARVGKTIQMTTLILSGVALGALLQSVVSYLIISSGDKIHGIIFWLMGSFSLSRWTEIAGAMPYVLLGLIVILFFARPLNVIQLGEEQAQQLGISVEKVKLILIAAATLITAAAVSFVGIIGFVGIIVPHTVRLVWGADHRSLLPLSVLSGAIFMVLADLLARTVLTPTEVPVGVITALFGAPFFLYLLRRKKNIVF